MQPRLDILAGPHALRVLRARGLRAEDVDMVAAASGGPKWIVLHGLDRALLTGLLATSQRSIPVVGSSSGAWRMACWAQRDPLAALDRMAEAYIGQRYPARPSLALVSRTCAGIVSHLLGEHGAGDILAAQRFRLHVLTAACHGLTASDARLPLLTGLVMASVCNAAHRRALGWFMERVIFGVPHAENAFAHLRDLPTRHVAMGAGHVAPALLATGSIPLLAEAVDIADAPAGRYRDGALTDYHPAFDFGQGEGVVLYPHFFSHLIPGWLDRFAPGRRPSPRNLDRVVLIAPSKGFVASLPGGKIPDRNDFYTLSDDARIARWEAVRDASAALGEELNALIASGRIVERVRPLT
ncbi:MAG: patatin-like phospholipase family protein [Proteobacteria bacterium]|nr:patatin-like phospholipase family protein [Pseudomonadota bacterium]